MGQPPYKCIYKKAKIEIKIKLKFVFYPFIMFFLTKFCIILSKSTTNTTKSKKNVEFYEPNRFQTSKTIIKNKQLFNITWMKKIIRVLKLDMDFKCYLSSFLGSNSTHI